MHSHSILLWLHLSVYLKLFFEVFLGSIEPHRKPRASVLTLIVAFQIVSVNRVALIDIAKGPANLYTVNFFDNLTE